VVDGCLYEPQFSLFAPSAPINRFFVTYSEKVL
jgi:hypothetical protein